MADMKRTGSNAESWAGVGRLLAAGGMAMAIAIVVNLAIYTIANAIMSDPIIDPNSGDEMPVAPVIVSTILAIAVATAVFALVVRRFHRSVRTFVVIAAVVLLLSLGPVIGTPDVPGASRLVLGLMHVATAVITVSVLTTRGAGNQQLPSAPRSR